MISRTKPNPRNVVQLLLKLRIGYMAGYFPAFLIYWLLNLIYSSKP